MDLIICVTGPESTGKTTLARQLADALAAPLVPEIARKYLKGRSQYGREDLLAIAELQLAAETKALSQGSVAVADTDLLVIAIWWQEKYGSLPSFVERALSQRSRRCYLLMQPDLPWEPDPLRESSSSREYLLERHRAFLSQASFPFGLIAGKGERRFQDALDLVRSLMN